MTAKAAAATRPGRGRGVQTWKKDPGMRRQRVLDEATRLFSMHGYANVSTSDIARAAGVAEGSVFHYFGSKQELLRAVGERYGVEFASAMFSGLDPLASRETVETMVSRAFAFVAGNWPGFGLFLLSDDPAAAPLAQLANRISVTRAVETVLVQWKREGTVGDVDAPVVAELLFGLVESALRATFASGNQAIRPRFERETVRAIASILSIADSAAARPAKL